MPEYRFDVDANTKKAEQNVNDLISLLGRVDKAAKNASKSNSYKADSNTLDLLNDYTKLESTYKNINSEASKYEQSPSFKGKTDDFQKLETALQRASSTLGTLSKGINSLSSSDSNGIRQYVKDTEKLNTNLGDTAKLIKETQRQETRVRKIGNQQDRISASVANTGYLSLRNWGTYTKNQAQIEAFPELIANNNGMIHDLQEQREALQRQTINGLSTNGTPISSEQLKQNHYDMNMMDKAIHRLQSANTTIESAQDAGTKADTTMSVTKPLIGGKAAAALVGVDLVKKVIGFIRNDLTQGKQINQSTGEQALNIGNVTGHASDDFFQSRVQQIMSNNKLGYTTQEGLDYYSLAQKSRKFNPDDKSDLADQKSARMTNAFEVAGRSTGIADKSWQETANAAMNSGGLLTDRDIYRLSSTIAGENMRSGNAGDTEGNAKIITSAIQQLSRSGTLGQAGISNLAATTALLSRSNKQFSGEQGQQNISNINQAFQNAGSGKDSALLYMKIRSNPTRYGGPVGMLRAQEELSKGLGDTSNIGFVQQYIRQVSQSGEQGRAYGALFLENHLGLSASASDKLSKDMVSGKYSAGALAKEANALKKKGDQQTKENLKNYQSSDQATYNREKSQREARQSRASASTKWYRQLKNAITNAGSGIGGLIGGGIGASGMIPSGAGSGNPGSVGTPQAGTNSQAKIDLNKAVKQGKKKSNSSSQGGGLFGTVTVHGATLSKKEKEKDNKSRTQSSGATITEKEQAESRSKSFLNTRDTEKNLRVESDNIDRRKEALKEFSRLLKEEHDNVKSSGGGKAGTVKKSSSSKSKDKSKKDKKGKSSAKTSKKSRTVDKKRSSGKTSKHKTLTNNNKIIVNMPSSKGTPAAIGGEIGNKVSKALETWSKNWISGD